MKTFFTILIGLLMLATLGMLLYGMLGMARGGDDPARSNRLMRYRVLLQGAAVALFVATMLLMRG